LKARTCLDRRGFSRDSAPLWQQRKRRLAGRFPSPCRAPAHRRAARVTPPRTTAAPSAPSITKWLSVSSGATPMARTPKPDAPTRGLLFRTLHPTARRSRRRRPRGPCRRAPIRARCTNGRRDRGTGRIASSTEAPVRGGEAGSLGNGSAVDRKGPQRDIDEGGLVRGITAVVSRRCCPSRTRPAGMSMVLPRGDASARARSAPASTWA